MVISTGPAIVRVSPGGGHLIRVRNDQRTLEDEAFEEGGVPGDGGHGDHPAHGVAVEEHRGARHPGLDLGAVSASAWSVESLLVRPHLIRSCT